MTTFKPPIYFHFLHKSFPFKHRKQVKAFLALIFKKENIPLYELHYVFCTDKYLLKLNIDFLRHNTYTDVITFTLSEPDFPINGEIYISIDRVKQNAISFNTTFNYELHRVIFHGILHLCGFSDKTKEEKEHMREKEDYYLHQYFVSRETI